ncbi:transcriptional regulator family: Fungal Specific TF [Penicillium malachiteum]|uniref:transcriptional regulator family: Fungal Specific TF n=1 Tax=Penicillium malachiteum TaxID=1324776 RepID=UPI0025498C5B|nr:transcriptional regulator family: Fungal Specific TF [Penicillium malachiteum]KAJ5718857.1 transcriptional regulator family: Fungal Specific TF [Penicillium malachiteum]
MTTRNLQLIHVVYFIINVTAFPRNASLSLTGIGDGIRPKCGRCLRTGRACLRGEKRMQFRQAKDRGFRTRFPRNQVWLKPPPRVDFILESGSGDTVDDIEQPLKIDNSEHANTTVDSDTVQVNYEQLETTSLETPSLPPTELESDQYPYLPSFDCTDRQQHFAVHIPYRARYCDTLFNAIMALSARHLSHTAQFDTFLSDHYYQACLETLIPSLNDHEVTMDDDLLAATVILRLLEEFDVPLAGSDLRGHSFGTKAFIQGPPPSMTTTPSLRQAVYWSGLRQEIYNALSLQQAPDIDLSSLHSLFTALGPDAGDCAWANQSIAHCADVLLFCFGTGPRSVGVYETLRKQYEQWSEARPSSFDPYFVGGDEVEVGASFPDIRFSSPWHAIGNQYAELARILLAVHDPTIPTVGPLRRRVVQEADSRIRKGVATDLQIGRNKND